MEWKYTMYLWTREVEVQSIATNWNTQSTRTSELNPSTVQYNDNIDIGGSEWEKSNGAKSI